MSSDQKGEKNEGTERAHPSVSSRSGSYGSSSNRTSSVEGRKAYTTEFVRALFQTSVGEVIGDFSCSFQRQAGRLYIASKGLYFYSNLFGFERKIEIQFEKVVNVSIIRRTSIQVRTSAEEVIIFRSFEDRDAVLEIVRPFCGICDTSNTCNSSSADGVNCQESPVRQSSDISVVINHEMSRESESDESDHDDSGVQVAIRGSEGQMPQFSADDSTANSKASPKVVADSACSDTETWSKIVDDTETWSKILQVDLPCKRVSDFFAKFLADDAPHSLDVFHTSIGDKNISVGMWSSSFLRSVRFDHHATPAKVLREQDYQTYGGAACLRNKTTVGNIPGSSSFHVEDIWLIQTAGESEDDQRVLIDVKYRIKFTSKTMLKSIITRRTGAETKGGYMQYFSFVQQKLGAQDELLMPGPGLKAPTFADRARALLRDALSAFERAPVSTALVLFAFLYATRLKQTIKQLEMALGDFEERMADFERMLSDRPPQD
mmetsp:Transcript_29441/g.66476  ORF Transcript_29441/g.66476 Transcript_29441/m.66476 type:complete len:490 (+) Transcript_29441:121-1590(+)